QFVIKPGDIEPIQISAPKADFLNLASEGANAVANDIVDAFYTVSARTHGHNTHTFANVYERERVAGTFIAHHFDTRDIRKLKPGLSVAKFGCKQPELFNIPNSGSRS